jgi:hypothetical protein
MSREHNALLDFMCAARNEMLTGLQILTGSFVADTMTSASDFTTFYTYVVLDLRGVRRWTRWEVSVGTPSLAFLSDKDSRAWAKRFSGTTRFLMHFQTAQRSETATFDVPNREALTALLAGCQ